MKISECVLVVGTNYSGIHGKGAAYDAKILFGLRQGMSEGLCGNAYALPTKQTPYKTLPLGLIAIHIARFLDLARSMSDKTFLVTRVACGYAGHTDKDIAPLFSGAPNNCILPDFWSKTHQVHHIEAITKADMDKEVW